MAPPTGDLRRVPLDRRLRLGLLAGALAGALAAVAVLPVEKFAEYFLTFEDRTLDFRQRLFARRTPAVDGVAIVLIDDASVEKLAALDPDLRWPWPRELQATIVRFLKKAGARAVLFDVLFVDQSRVGPDDDRGFGKAIDEAGKVTLAIKLDEGPAAPAPAALRESLLDVPGWTYPGRRLDGRPLNRAIVPVEEILAGKPRLGAINVNQDPDNTIRSADLLFPFEGKFLPSLGLRAALESMPAPVSLRASGRHLFVGDRAVPLDWRGRPLVRFYGPELTFPSYHAADLVTSWANLEEGKDPVIPLEKFRDRVVFVAVSIAGNEDIITAPTSTRMRGVELHATLCANLLAGEFLRRPAPTLRYALVLLPGVLGGLLTFGIWRPLPGLWAALGLIALWTGGALLAFRQGLVLDLFYPSAAILLAYTASALAGYFGEGRAKREVARAFGQYLSPVVIHDLMKKPGGLKLGGEEREITVFFSDLQGFSSFSEGMGPEELVSFLNLYLGAMTEVILTRRGVVDKYEGDAIMAFWGAPELMPSDAEEACLAAIEQVEALAALNDRFRAEGRPTLKLRAGLNRGPAVVGNMGSARRFAYTAMGDTVNLASRLEGANKFFGTSLLVSEAARVAAGAAVVARRLGRIRVVGRSSATTVYDLRGRAGAVGGDELRRIAVYEEAVSLLERGEALAAESRLADLVAQAPDPAAERCLRFTRERIAAAGAPWDGVWELTAK